MHGAATILEQSLGNGMPWRWLLRLFVLLAGALFACFGLLLLGVAATGGVREGLAGIVVVGTGLLFVSAPAIALPFSKRMAVGLLLVVLGLFALGALGMAFLPIPGAQPTLVFRIAVVALFPLLALRVFGSWRRMRQER
jgi:hypothetical protein